MERGGKEGQDRLLICNQPTTFFRKNEFPGPTPLKTLFGPCVRLRFFGSTADTLHLSPRDIIAMTALHGTKVDALRLPLRKKLTAIADLPSHIVAFRGTLGRLTTVGQVPLALDAYRWFLATLSPFPVFQQYTLLFTVGHGALRSKRLRPMPLTFCRNCITSSPTPTIDPLREISKIQSWGRRG